MLPDFVFNHVGIGYAYLLNENLDQAHKSFENTISKWPDFAPAHSGMGWIHLATEEFDEAESNFQKSLQIDPNFLDGHVGLGWVYLNKFDTEKSKKEFEAAITLMPDLTNAYYGLGTLYMMVNDYDKALETLNKAISLGIQNVEVLVAKGSILLSQDKEKEAEEALLAATKTEPNPLAYRLLGNLEYGRYEYKKALDYYEQAIQLDPNDMLTHSSQAIAMSHMGRFDEAISIVSPHRDSALMKATLASFYYLTDKTGEAETLLKEASNAATGLESNEAASTYYIIAEMYSSLNNYEEAKKYLSLAQNSDPYDTDPYIYYGYVYVYSSLGEFKQAEEALQKASALEHSSFSIRIAKAQLLVEEGRLVEADKEAQAAIKLDANSSQAHAVRAQILNLQSRYKEALSEAKIATALDPYNSLGQAQLAYAFYKNKMLNNALEAAQKAVRLNTLDNTNHFILGVCYMENKMKNEAIAEFEKFLDNYWERTYTQDFKREAEVYLFKLKSQQ